MRTALTGWAMVALVAGAWPVDAASDLSALCARRKLRGSGLHTLTRLRCESHGAKTGDAAEPLCLAVSQERAQRAFDRAEVVGGCQARGDSAAAAARVEELADDVRAALPFAASESAQACAATKLVMAGIAARRRMTCFAQATGHGGFVSQACLDSAEERLATIFASAEAKGGCTTTGDAALVQALVDAATDELITLLTGCGDGAAAGPEECDDGGHVGGDGCAAFCGLEDTSAVCTGVPSVSGTALTSVLVSDALSRPVDLQAPRLDPHRLFVVEQEGRIRVIRSGTLLATPFLDIDPLVVCCGERGFLGLAFHPDYEENGLFFVNYTNNAGHTTIARYRVDAGNPDVADPTSAKILLVIGQPFVNHNAGQLAFGPDGYLYLGMGDGGGGGDPLETAQDDTNLLGKMLRLDVDVDAPPWYAVPPSNPHYDDGSGLLELIWAKGFRNPWRYSFDRDNGDLYVADVGQDAIEEIDFQPAASTGGENYGWDVFEGTACFEPAPAPFCPVPPSGFRFPVHQYSHPAGCSVTGGYVYRGCALPSLRGTYFYSDFCTSFVRTFRVTAGAAGSHANRTSEVESSGVTLDNVTSFGQDARGELYVVDLDGDVLKIVPQ